MIEQFSSSAITLYRDLLKGNKEKAKKAFKGMPYFIYDTEQEHEYAEFESSVYNNFNNIINCFCNFKQLEECGEDYLLQGIIFVPEVPIIKELLFLSKEWSIRESEHFFNLIEVAYQKLNDFSSYEIYTVNAYVPDFIDFCFVNLPRSYDTIEIDVV